MTLAEQIEGLVLRGFSIDQAETLVLMREAAISLFRVWPESFLLYGGANLILFHDSVRHSSDLDLLLRSDELPTIDEVSEVLSAGLEPLSGLLNIGALRITDLRAGKNALKLAVMTEDDRTVFTVDLARLGSVITTGVEEHPAEALAGPGGAIIKAVARDHLLLQKAEAFIFRSRVKARDAYDIRLLVESATLDANLRTHLNDSLAWREIEGEDIQNRIADVTEDLCRAELQEFLPERIYAPLAKAGFRPLRDSLSQLFKEWI
jgi:nucleotidyltransferase AbiEii toxin of type IV toxin-antitoxin system